MESMLRRQLPAVLAALAAAGYPLRREPELRLDLRGASAGQARLGENRLRLNAALLEREGADFARDTLIHELCHLAVWERHGRRARPHGPEWQALMRALGCVPQRCHNAAVTPLRSQRRFRYACDCSVHDITTTRHRRAQRGVRYLCRRCSGPLRPVPAGGEDTGSREP